MNILTSFAQWTIHYCKRSANQVAGMLAHYEMPGNSAEIAELPPHIHLQFTEEKERATAYTRSFYYYSAEVGYNTQHNSMVNRLGECDAQDIASTS